MRAYVFSILVLAATSQLLINTTSAAASARHQPNSEKYHNCNDERLAKELQEGHGGDDYLINASLEALPQKSDVVEAIEYGILSMKCLYEETEPQLYAKGLFLNDSNPAHSVATFNRQTVEYKQLAKVAYAALEATKKFRKKFPALSRQALKNTMLSALGAEQQQQQQETLCLSSRRGRPTCPPASRKYRTADGSCNNDDKPWWGSAMSTNQRFLPAVYDDGVESIRRSVTGGGSLPSARRVSATIHRERDAPLGSITHMLMQWGQFIDHDVTATGQSQAFNGSVPQCCLPNGAGFQPRELMHPDCLPIAVPPDDARLGAGAAKGRAAVRCLEFVRSGPAPPPEEDCAEATLLAASREQLNQVTSFVDASTIYSSSAQQSDALRIFRDGLMQYGNLQQQQQQSKHDDVCLQGSLSTGCFRAGDGRLSEQPALISLHVVFLRLHNRLAGALAAINPHWTDERIFQEARKIVGALVQHVTWREFLPIVLGQKVLRTFDLELVREKGAYYHGYDPSVNPNIANGFAAAAYRFGHSLVQGSFVRYDPRHCPLSNNVSIHEEFANPVNLETAGSVERIVLGLVNQPAQRRDEFISEELTGHLFQTPGFPFGMDLAAINVQRGRDHGIAPFVEWRRACALNRIRDWADLERVMSRETAQRFKSIYAAVEDIDLFSGGLAEKSVGGGLVGPTFACIIAQQFRNLRKGDRFWYENHFADESGFSLDQLAEIRRSSLAQILCSTLSEGGLDDIQPFVMLSVDELNNRRLPCNDSSLRFMNLEPWRQVQLENAAAAAAATATARAFHKRQRRRRRPEKPNKTRINQQNRVTVMGARPLGGPRDNMTIVINNNVVYSPVYVKDSVYGSHQVVVRQQQQQQQQQQQADREISGTATDKPSSSKISIDYESNFENGNSDQPYYPKNFGNPHSPDSPPPLEMVNSPKGWLRDLLMIFERADAASAAAAAAPLRKENLKGENLHRGTAAAAEARVQYGNDGGGGGGVAGVDSSSSVQQDWNCELPNPIVRDATTLDG